MSKSKSTQNNLLRLKRRIDDFAEILYETEEFTQRDLHGDWGECHSIVQLMRHCDAIAVKTKEKRDGKYLRVYEWANFQGRLQEYYENRNELPCGHRAHIPPKTNEDGEYLCKFCGEPHPKEVIENAL